MCVCVSIFNENTSHSSLYMRTQPAENQNVNKYQSERSVPEPRYESTTPDSHCRGDKHVSHCTDMQNIICFGKPLPSGRPDYSMRVYSAGPCLWL